MVLGSVPLYIFFTGKNFFKIILPTCDGSIAFNFYHNLHLKLKLVLRKKKEFKERHLIITLFIHHQYFDIKNSQTPYFPFTSHSQWFPVSFFTVLIQRERRTNNNTTVFGLSEFEVA